MLPTAQSTSSLFGASSASLYNTRPEIVSSSYSTNFGSLADSKSNAFSFGANSTSNTTSQPNQPTSSSFGSGSSFGFSTYQPSQPFQPTQPSQPRRPNRSFRLFSEPSTEPAFTPPTPAERKITALQDELKSQREKTIEFRDKYNDANLLNNILKEEIRDEKLKSAKFEYLYREEKAKNQTIRDEPRYQLRPRRVSRHE